MNIALISLNVGLLAVFYTLLGGMASFIIYYLFEDHSEEWEKKSLWYQLVDIILELCLVGLAGFWFTYNIKEYPPLVPMSKNMDVFVDTYVSAIFFGYSMFIFLDDLTKKIRYMYNVALRDAFEKILPNGVLVLFLRKTDV